MAECGRSGTVSYNDPAHVHATTLSTIPNQYASYDAMGQMTCRTTDTTGSQSCAAGTQTGATMSYDNIGRLTTWTAPTGLNESEQFLYDNEGQPGVATQQHDEQWSGQHDRHDHL